MRFAFPATTGLWDSLQRELQPMEALVFGVLALISMPLDIALWPLRLLGWVVLVLVAASSKERWHMQFGHGDNQKRPLDYSFPGYFECPECGLHDESQSWRWKRRQA